MAGCVKQQIREALSVLVVVVAAVCESLTNTPNFVFTEKFLTVTLKTSSLEDSCSICTAVIRIAMIDISDESHAFTNEYSDVYIDMDDIEQGKSRRTSFSSISSDIFSVLPPLSYIWKLMYVLLYILGGASFVLGSVCYLPQLNYPAKGAYYFICGSFGFMLSDLAELRSSIYDCYVEQNKRRICTKGCEKKSMVALMWESEDTLKACLMGVGSTMYFVGCVLFIPAFDPVWGTIMFIAGSAIIDIAEFWKIYRLGTNRYNISTGELERVPFDWKIVLEGNWALLCADLCNIMGVTLFLIGSVLFLPTFCLTTVDEHRAALLYIGGSFLFVICGCLMFYDTFISKRPVDEFE